MTTDGNEDDAFKYDSVDWLEKELSRKVLEFQAERQLERRKYTIIKLDRTEDQCQSRLDNPP